ncbi:N-acetylglucosamine-6-phosphate deacetylase [Vibrio sp. SS-MA-C1-2]|uniref:N-acetylglucosamine-6-phosphate deacetylase n=1 Tax=Vibrio sp. SS-MA-C1-2 TaxID=2908646 RepID=UPI001F2E8342|nr:N-acetylglucosamine-6-phosphate deacetylase [Vibrio sp. SS-MA-C1-2]UJF18669.1 N-acetylglucosamine-6-phosphate deacetylase [Vibrio sp. SS-MA-C1-2]
MSHSTHYALTNGRIYTGYDVLDDHAVIINNELIEAIVPVAELSAELATVDVQGANITPGFIDLQLNGCGGVMFNNDISPDTLATMHQANLKSGCTSFLPTFITSSDDGMKAAIKATHQYQAQHKNHTLGVHLEGPYLNIEKKGIHSVDYIREPDAEMIQYICDHADVVAKITLAPEKCPTKYIKQLADAGIVVSAGHSNATYQEARIGFSAGITFTTHLFNAMTSIAGRDPGLVGAIYDSSEVYSGVIADGFHVSYANIRLAHRVKGEKLVLVSDATAPAGANIDSFDFVGKTVYYKDGKCFGEDGTLGGSAVTMIESVENTVKHVGIALDETLRMASLYPAKAINVADRLGALKAGYIANITIFDNSFNVKATVVNGQYH